MRDRSLAAAGGGITVLALLAQVGPNFLVGSVDLRSIAGWVPIAETAGEAVTLLLMVLGPLHPMVAVGLAVAVGYYAGARPSGDSNLRRLATAVGAGSLLVVAIGGAVVVFAQSLLRGRSVTVEAIDVAFYLGTVVGTLFESTLLVATGAVAGAALATERTGSGLPETGDPSDDGDERSAERADEPVNSRSTAAR